MRYNRLKASLSLKLVNYFDYYPQRTRMKQSPMRFEQKGNRRGHTSVTFPMRNRLKRYINVFDVRFVSLEDTQCTRNIC